MQMRRRVSDLIPLKALGGNLLRVRREEVPRRGLGLLSARGQIRVFVTWSLSSGALLIILPGCAALAQEDSISKNTHN